ncbi:RNA-binding S4 domain-containing protein [Planctomicrobium piriforme]|uniref:Ribosome-associated protein n=1 Tax=Planctomicrobium piriforme TaxID=1576369 RepID=A0A1I3G0H7_9PLAN|nr:RNA-binding S4 domain-containing protein [Planctomicrobium piriforme]SFI16980.1 ribosome-associated protein [Planctomicrobium piriforme]
MSEPETAQPEESLRLDQFMKITGLAQTGGQAKLVIQGGEVTVNGQVETRRRRKLVPGDLVSFDGHELEVALDEES